MNVAREIQIAGMDPKMAVASALREAYLCREEFMRLIPNHGYDEGEAHDRIREAARWSAIAVDLRVFFEVPYEDECLGFIGDSIVFGADFGTMEHRILGSARDWAGMDYGTMEISFKKNRQLSAYGIIDRLEKIARPADFSGPSWEQFRDRRHGRRKQRRK